MTHCLASWRNWAALRWLGPPQIFGRGGVGVGEGRRRRCGDGGFGGVRGVVGVVVLSSGVGGAWEVWGGRSVHMLAYIRYIQLLNDDLEA